MKILCDIVTMTAKPSKDADIRVRVTQQMKQAVYELGLKKGEGEAYIVREAIRDFLTKEGYFSDSAMDAVAAAGKGQWRPDAAVSGVGGVSKVVDPRISATKPPKTQLRQQKSTG